MISLLETGKGSYLLSVTGEIDEVHEVEAFSGVLNQALHATKDTLIIDLSQVDFLTGAAFSLLRDIRQQLEVRGKRLVLVPGHFTGHILRKTGWLESFTVAVSLGEAVWYPEMAASA